MRSRVTAAAGTSFLGRYMATTTRLTDPSFRPQHLALGNPCYIRSYTLFSSDTMGHAVDHALRNAPLDKPHPPWLQQLQAQWQAAKHALGRTRGSPSRHSSIDGPRPSQDKSLRRKSSLHSLKEALLQTKDTLLAAIRMLPRKHAEGSEDSWLYRLLEMFRRDLYKHLTDIISLDPTCPQLQLPAMAMPATHQNLSSPSSTK